MANRNTKRLRKERDGYGQKRGYAIDSSFGGEHGTQKHQGPKQHGVPLWKRKRKRFTPKPDDKPDNK